MRKKISIIGGGPAAMAVASFLDPNQYEITIYEKNKSLGRKFLVAGKGGFNLTHNNELKIFSQQYSPTNFLTYALKYFDNTKLRTWLKSIGIPTFVGSSHRVYPEKGTKPIEVLHAIIAQLNEQGVAIKYEHEWVGWTEENNLLFSNKQIAVSDINIFALGGGSWKVTGSTGNWIEIFQNKGIETNQLAASNCAYQIVWGDNYINKHWGQPLKNIAIRCAHRIQKGEAIITPFGLEGNAIYALSPQIRAQLKENKKAIIYIDLKPTVSQEKIKEIFVQSKQMKTSDILRKKLNLSTTQIDLIKDKTSKDDFLNITMLAKTIKNLRIDIIGTATVDEAISTVGGISLNEIDKKFKLNKIPNHYCIGEMLDYDAPTGGYLLQSCFSMGAYLASILNKTE